MDSFDIAVIGAGPAGTYAACSSAKTGLRTVVFEEHERIVGSGALPLRPL